MGGGLNLNPGNDMIDSYNTSISNAGMKIMFRQLKQQAQDDAAKQLKYSNYDATIAAQKILRDSTDYAINENSSFVK